MSTLAAADLDSDDEHDQDFKPDEPKLERSKKRRRSGSQSSASDTGDEGDVVESGEAAALRAEQEAAETESRRKRAEEAFLAMKAGGSAPTVDKPKVIMVDVQRARRFAGETI